LQNPAIQERYAGPLTSRAGGRVPDTNPLQNEILELLERDNLFRVGDENQSIYGFRHAEVRVFREHAEAAAVRGRAEKLTSNFRSRGEVLDAIDMAFGSEEVWGDAYEPCARRPARVSRRRASSPASTARDRPAEGPLGRLGRRRRGPVRRRAARRAAMARGRGPAARAADRRADPRRLQAGDV